MKAKELRIGNWVNGMFNTNDGLIEKPFQISHIVISEIAEGVSDYTPIPLTEEWLVKFGFVKDHSYDDVYFDINVVNRWLTINDNQFHISDDRLSVVDDEYWTDIYYVHQLQNLYFALTNKELL